MKFQKNVCNKKAPEKCTKKTQMQKKIYKQSVWGRYIWGKYIILLINVY